MFSKELDLYSLFLSYCCSHCYIQHVLYVTQVLGGDAHAAQVLAAEVHRDLSDKELELEKDLPQLNLPLDQCGMWIDPIGNMLI